MTQVNEMQKVLETVTYVIFDTLHKEYFARTDDRKAEYFTPDIELAKSFSINQKPNTLLKS